MLVGRPHRVRQRRQGLPDLRSAARAARTKALHQFLDRRHEDAFDPGQRERISPYSRVDQHFDLTSRTAVDAGMCEIAHPSGFVRHRGIDGLDRFLQGSRRGLDPIDHRSRICGCQRRRRLQALGLDERRAGAVKPGTAVIQFVERDCALGVVVVLKSGQIDRRTRNFCAKGKYDVRKSTPERPASSMAPMSVTRGHATRVRPTDRRPTPTFAPRPRIRAAPRNVATNS